MRITKRSPIRRMIRDLEALWQSPEGFEELTNEQLGEWFGITAAYVERLFYRVDVLQKRIGRVENDGATKADLAELRARLDRLEQPKLPLG